MSIAALGFGELLLTLGLPVALPILPLALPAAVLFFFLA